MSAAWGIKIPERVAKRGFEKWTLGPNGCHISSYKSGKIYANISWRDADGTPHCSVAHRAAWVHVHGQIRGKLTVDHQRTCDRRCVNVDHLRLLSRVENIRRTRDKEDWPLGTCVNGHSNRHLKFQKDGSRTCYLCWNVRQRRRRAKAKQNA